MDEDHWQQNARARFFFAVLLFCLVFCFFFFFLFTYSFRFPLLPVRPYLSSVSLLDARFLDAFVFNVAQQLSGPWRSTKRNSPQNASVRRQRRRQRQQRQQQRRVTSVRGRRGRGRGDAAAGVGGQRKKKYIRRTTKINVLSKYQQQARRVASALVCGSKKGECRGRGRGCGTSGQLYRVHVLH